MLTEDQTIALKTQLKKQIEHLPPDKKAEAEAQIDSLSSDALEEMLEEQRSKPQGKGENKSVFRRIIDGDIPAVLVEANSVSAAYMDITPVSRGNIIILPKRPIIDAKKLPIGCFTLAKKLASRIVAKLKASSTEIQTENKFGESYISIIPSYEKQLNINSQRKSVGITDLEEVAKLLRAKKRVKSLPPKPVVQAVKVETVRMSRRIP